MTRRTFLRLLALLAIAPAARAADLPYLPEGACLVIGGGYGGSTYGACTYGGGCSCLPPGMHRFEDPIFADDFETGDASRWR